MNRILLNGAWQAREKGTNESIPARVPGSIFLDLLAAKKIDDPFFGLNEKQCPQVFEKDWIFSRQFDVPGQLLECERIFLEFDGIDTIAEIFLNGKKIAQIDNMHRRYRFEVKQHLRRTAEARQNLLEIHISSPTRYVTPLNQTHHLKSPIQAIQGGPYLRKCASSFGWDWGPQIPDMGIWRDVRLCGFSGARIKDVLIRQDHAERHVDVNCRIKLENLSGEPFRLNARLFDPDGNAVAECEEETVETVLLKLPVKNPKLWYPNGYGHQPLYTLQIDLMDSSDVLDSYEKKIGLRKLGVEQKPDEFGRTFTVVVNECPIFCRGANWIPSDNFLPRNTAEKYQFLIKSAAEVNFNMLRVWGGGIYEDDAFYNLCDEYGILVWQDFMFSCAIYPIDESFAENVKLEAIDNIRRLRHHPCLALWCGNNEMEWGWVEWGWSQEYAAEWKAGYSRMFEKMLPEICAEEDPDRLYWQSSPSSGGQFDQPNDESRGDGHYWQVWHGRKPFTAYREHYFRFMSEFGFESFPSIKTIKAFAPENELNFFSRVMENHQKNSAGNELIFYYISKIFRLPATFENQIYISQLLQAEAIRFGVEHWRRNRDRCMGTLYWQFNDCWSVASWASIDFFGRWKALQYFARRFFQPILVSAQETETSIELHVSNETRSRFEGELKWRLMDDAGVLKRGTEQIALEKLSTRCFAQLNFAHELAGEKKYSTWLAFSLKQGSSVIGTGSTIFVPYKHFNFRQPDIEARITESGGVQEIEIISKTYAKFVELDFETRDAIFSDNYFDLIPGEPRTVRVAVKGISAEQIKKELLIRSLYDAQR
ncbi:glycoside hydrolase family 2 protein [candidate division KSB1 bacterium]|nr:glycoside hydrolase family 2 protein [candidate division KSB1 bacterium]